MKSRTLACLNANPDVELMLGCGISAAEPALAALEELGMAGKVKLGTFDLSPGVLQAIVDGKMEWGIDAQQYAMGYIPVVMFDLLAKYKIAPIADYPTGPGFVTNEPRPPSSSFPSRASADARGGRPAAGRPRPSGSPVMTADAPDDRIRTVSCAARLLSRPEFGAAAGTALVFVFFALTAGGSGLFSAKGIVNFLEVSAQLGILAAAVSLL